MIANAKNLEAVHTHTHTHTHTIHLEDRIFASFLYSKAEIILNKHKKQKEPSSICVFLI